MILNDFLKIPVKHFKNKFSIIKDPMKYAFDRAEVTKINMSGRRVKMRTYWEGNLLTHRRMESVGGGGGSSVKHT